MRRARGTIADRGEMNIGLTNADRFNVNETGEGSNDFLITSRNIRRLTVIRKGHRSLYVEVGR